MEELIDGTLLPNITFLDYESTGLKDPAAVSLALIRYEDYKIKFAKYFLINPEKPIEYGAYKVHGISEEKVKNQPNFAGIWPEIQPYISGQIICGHNIKFDVGLTLGQIARYNLPCDSFKSICTYENSKKIISKQNIENYKLDTVCKYFGIDFGKHHDARDDTNSCRLIFHKISQIDKLTMKTVDVKK